MNKVDPLGLRPCDAGFVADSLPGGFDACSADGADWAELLLSLGPASWCVSAEVPVLGGGGVCGGEDGTSVTLDRALGDAAGDAVGAYFGLMDWLEKHGHNLQIGVLEMAARMSANANMSMFGTPSPLLDTAGALQAAVAIAGGGKPDLFCGLSPRGIPVKCVYEVDFRMGDRYGRTGGHVIFCSEEQDWCEDHRVIDHEMVHVGQHDEFGDLFELLYRLEERRNGYCGNKYEKEAFDETGDTCGSGP